MTIESRTIPKSIVSSIVSSIIDGIVQIYNTIVPPVDPSLDVFFRTSIPSGFSFTGSSSNATYWNSSGKLVAGASNTPRFELVNAISANPRLKMEGSRTNVHTNQNYNPTVTTGVTVAGGSAILSLVSDTTALAAAGLDQICTNGQVYLLDNSANGTTSYVEIDAGTANTNPHSCSVYARANVGSGVTLNILGAAAAVPIPTTGYTLVKLENATPSAVGRKVRISAVAGRKVWFILNQLEEAANCSSTILISGASGTRGADRLTRTTASLGSIFNQSEGAMVVCGDFDHNTPTQIPIIYSNGTTTNNIGLRVPTGSFIKALVTADSIQSTAESVSEPIPGKQFNCGLIWGNSAFSVHTIARRQLVNSTTLPTTSLTRLDIGSQYNGGSPMFGHIDRITLWNKKPAIKDIGPYLVSTGSVGIATQGQSLIDNFRISQVENDNTGEISAVSVMDSFLTSTTSTNYMLHGATGGSGALKRNTTGGAWWYDDLTGQWGDAWQTWEDVITTFLNGGGTIPIMILDQGQQDASAMEAGTCTPAEWINTWKNIIFPRMRTIIGANTPIIIMPTVGRTDVTGTAYQLLREAQWELASTTPNCYRGPETFDLPKGSGDPVHLSSAGYTTSAQRSMRKALKVLGYGVTGGIDGPSGVSAVRVGTTVTFTLAHDTGTDFTPTTGILGFKYLDGSGNNVALSNVNRASSTTITMTLASAVAGTLYYGYDTLLDAAGNYSNLVHDNSAQALPLRGCKISVA